MFPDVSVETAEVLFCFILLCSLYSTCLAQYVLTSQSSNQKYQPFYVSTSVITP